MAFLTFYICIGFVVAAVVYAKRHNPREKEIGNWIVFASASPFTLWLPILLWPLWLALLCIPKDTFVEAKEPLPPPAEDLIGSYAKVVIPLMPTGRVTIGDIYRDARAESGMIAAGEKVVVIATSVGGEIIVKIADQST